MICLASSSDTRKRLLTSAGLEVTVCAASLDEAAITASLLSENVAPRDVADALAEAKARKVAARYPDHITLGCDQVLDLDGAILSKPADPEEARAQVLALSGRTHRLHSAVVAFEGGAPVWRHVGTVRLTMRRLDPAHVARYVDRNWDSIRHSVGAYRLEEEGARFFTAVDGDYFTVLGLPLLPLLSWLVARGYLEA